MATRLEAFDFAKPSKITRTEKGNYPWDQWFDGDIWQIAQGEDFQSHPLMMERVIRTRATGRNAKVQIRHIPVNGDEFGIIVLQRTDIIGPTERAALDAQAKDYAAKAKRRTAYETRKAAKAAPEADQAEPVVKRTRRTTPLATAPAVAGTPTKKPSKRVAKTAA